MKFNFRSHKKTKDSVVFRKIEPAYRNPIQAWIIGLGIAVVLLIGGAMFLVLDFQKQMHATNRDIDVDIGEAKYRGGEVVQYADYYKKQEETFSSLRVTDFVDSSEETLSENEMLAEQDFSTTTASSSPDVDLEAPSIE